MIILKVEMNIIPNEDYNKDELITVIKGSLSEAGYKLVGTKYEEKFKETSPKLPVLNNTIDKAVFFIEIDRYFDYRVAIGCFSTISEMKYPGFKLYGINQEFVTIDDEGEEYRI